MAASPGLLLLKAGVEREQPLAIQILIDVKGAGSALKSMIRNKKETIIGGKLLQNQAESGIQQAKILNCMCF